MTRSTALSVRPETSRSFWPPIHPGRRRCELVRYGKVSSSFAPGRPGVSTPISDRLVSGRSLIACVSILSLIAGALTAGTAGAQDAAAIAQRLGDTIEVNREASGHSVDYGRAVATVDAPTDVVMRIITDYARYFEFMPRFTTSRVLSRRGNNALLYMEASVMRGAHTLWAQMRVYSRAPQGATQIIEGRMIEGNMERFVARWEVTPIEGGTRTLVAFRILVDPDLPFPSSIFTDENLNAAQRTMRALRERVRLPQFAVAHNP